MNKLTQETFLNQVQNHKMTMLLDSGTHRHLHFSNGVLQRFNIVTYPNYLTISGDIGSFVFAGGVDMFQFFRNGCVQTQHGFWGKRVVAGIASEWDLDEYDKAKHE